MIFEKFVILLVEDNLADIRLTREALDYNRVYHELFVARDGIEALDFLSKVGEYGDAPRPDLILLDLNLPKKDGREVLAEIKADPKLASIPVVVLTTSEDENDIQEAYNLYVNGYIVKPVDLPQFFNVIQKITEFWLTVAILPPQ